MKSEVFMVIQRRRDPNQLPDPVKSNEKVYFVREDAEVHFANLKEHIGDHYGIYRCSLEVEEKVK